MLVLTSRKAQPECRLPLVGTANRHKGATEIAPLLIVRDESHRLSLGRLLTSRACLRFAGCVQFAMKEYGRSRNFQRTANSVLTVCVSSRDKRTSLAGFQSPIPNVLDTIRVSGFKSLRSLGRSFRLTFSSKKRVTTVAS